MHRKRRLPHLFAAVILAAPLLAVADPTYTVTAVAGADSSAADLNNLGQVVGSMNTGGGAYHAFVSSGGSPIDLGTLGGSISGAASINDHGQIVGDSFVGGDQYVHGYIYSGGTMSPLPGPDYVRANGINDSGTVVGEMTVSTPDGDLTHAYSYSGGAFTDLGVLPIGDRSRALGINSAGDVVGAATNVVGGEPNFPEDPFLYHNGKMIDLGTFGPGGIWSGANAINDHGQIVGYAGIGDTANPDEIYPQTAFLYENGVLRNLGGLAPHWSSVAADINNLGQIVGSASLSATVAHGFLYENGQMIDLNTLIDPATGWVIASAAGINDLGQIAATACKGGVCEAVRLDLVSAVPEPHAYALLLAGLALGGRRARGWVGRRLRSPVLRRQG